MEDRKELRKLLEDALEGLGEKEELLDRLDRIEDKLDTLHDKLDKLNNAPLFPPIDQKTILDELEKIKKESHRPWKAPAQWPPYEACLSGEMHEYPSDWACILPPSCKKCGKVGLDMNSISGRGWQDGLQTKNTLNTLGVDTELYLDDTGVVTAKLKLSDTLHATLNSPIVPEGASIVSNGRVTGSAIQPTPNGSRASKLSLRPRNKNNAYWKF